MSRSPFALLVLLVVAAPAAADTLKVPQDYATPQEAVDAAVDGDEIVVKGGSWTAPLLVDDKHDLVLRGTGLPFVDAHGLDQGIAITNSSNIELRGFDVEGAGLSGIFVGDSTDVLVTKCRVLGAHDGVWAEAGIRVSGGSDVRVERNHILGAVILGIRFYSDTGPHPDASTIVRNHVHDLWHAGIEAYGTNLLVERNRIHDSVSEGIWMDASDSLVLRNRIAGGVAGITIFQGSGNVLERNRIKSAEHIGIWSAATASATTLIRNRVVKSGETWGVALQSDDCSLDHDRIVKAQGIGLLLDGTVASAVSVRITSPGGHGVQLDGDQQELTDVRVTHAGADGFHVAGTGNTLTEARATGSAELDLEDPNGMGANTYIDCVFKTSNLP